MNLKVGIDIIEIERIEKAITKRKTFKQKLYTEKEIEYCESQKNSLLHYAARFCAKEAVMKALGTGWAQGVTWTQIEILNHPSGEPYVNLYDTSAEIAGERKIVVSLSHSKSVASAVAVLYG